MKVGDLVKRSPITVEEGSSIRWATKVMAENRVGLVVIVDPYDKAKVKGVLSERDVIRAVAKGLNLDDNVMKVATKDVITVDVDDRVDEAAILMSKHGIRHLVVTKEGKLYGVISMRDIIGEERILRALTAMF